MGSDERRICKIFPDNRPARSAFAGTGLARGARVEIECIAKLN